MPNIHWTDDLNIGIESIDEQHHHIVNLFNKLNEAHKRGEITAANKLFYELIEFKLSHCVFEEELLKKSGYPLYKMHKHSHEPIIKKFLALHQRAENGEYVINEAVPFLETTLLRHMKGEDADYSIYMRQSHHNEQERGFFNMLKRIFQ